MSIFPLPVFEADEDPELRDGLTLEEQLERLEPPKTIVVRFGRMGMVGEYPSDGSIRPGCGSKLIARTHRGVEMTEMLTTTCTNAGCGKSVTRKDMRGYIENSGGADYPFHNTGSILRIATAEDMGRESRNQEAARERRRIAKSHVEALKLDLSIVDVELILGGDHITVHYMIEEKIDTRPLQKRLAAAFTCRIDMHQVGARDEARLVADYEKCGQHCCCKNFLKVLKPVSMRSAKQQKATLDPLKISGRCGRLMCCLRYEDQTYKELKSNLPHRKTKVGTSEGPGIVVDSKILTQLVLVELDHNRTRIAVPLEELLDPDTCPNPEELERQQAEQARTATKATPQQRRRNRKGQPKSETPASGQTPDSPAVDAGEGGDKPKKKRRRRRRRRSKGPDS
jgi:cell fate regulator YaaT (PSP1 superfamily)